MQQLSQMGNIETISTCKRYSRQFDRVYESLACEIFPFFPGKRSRRESRFQMLSLNEPYSGQVSTTLHRGLRLKTLCMTRLKICRCKNLLGHLNGSKTTE